MVQIRFPTGHVQFPVDSQVPRGDRAGGMLTFHDEASPTEVPGNGRAGLFRAVAHAVREGRACVSFRVQIPAKLVRIQGYSSPIYHEMRQDATGCVRMRQDASDASGCVRCVIICLDFEKNISTALRAQKQKEKEREFEFSAMSFRFQRPP